MEISDMCRRADCRNLITIAIVIQLLGWYRQRISGEFVQFQRLRLVGVEVRWLGSVEQTPVFQRKSRFQLDLAMPRGHRNCRQTRWCNDQVQGPARESDCQAVPLGPSEARCSGSLIAAQLRQRCGCRSLQWRNLDDCRHPGGIPMSSHDEQPR